MIIERWKNAQAYVIGRYHIENNLPCQDRTFYLEENGVKIMALADGAGSQPKSEIGAEIVCSEICKLISNNFNDYLMRFEYEKTNKVKHDLNMKELSKIIISHLVQKLKDKAILLNVPLKELSSTMLFFAIKDNHYIMGHIGDGAIAGLYNENNSKRLRALSEAENGAAANITFFVPDIDAVDHLRLKTGRIENLIGIVMTSDGAGDVLFTKDGIDNSVYELFSKFSMKTSEIYHDILSDFLSKLISQYSTDDLSLNLLSLEDNDTKDIDDHYANYILDDITSDCQIVRKSQYCYYLDSSINPKKHCFNNPDDVKRYLKWS